MRIASLIPAATDAVVALGHGPELVGVTHECDLPPGLDAAILTTTAIEDGATPAQIDDAVARDDAHTPYLLDEESLRAVAPDIVFAQSTCAVCAPDAAAVSDAVCAMPATVFSYDPRRLDDIVALMTAVGVAIGDEREGLALTSHLERRLDWLNRRLSDVAGPSAALLEWPVPVFAPGHWLPDLLEAAGAESVLGSPGDKSEPVTLEEVGQAGAEVIVLAFCGLDLGETQSAHDSLRTNRQWRAASGEARLYAVDGSRQWSRPGPQVIDGVEALAAALHDPHPDLRPPPGRISLFDGMRWVDPFAIDAAHT